MNALPILAQLGGYSVVQIVVSIIIIAAVVAILVVVLRQLGIAIPPWVIQIAWIIAVAVVGIMAIYFLLNLVHAL